MTSSYNTPRGPRSIGDAPPRPLSNIGHLSELPSAHQMSRNGMINLSELTITDLRLGLGVDTSKGDYVRIPVTRGNEAEGFYAGFVLGRDVAGEGDGSVQIVGSKGSALDPDIASAGLSFDPADPQDIDHTIKESGVDQSAQVGQAVMRDELDAEGNVIGTYEVIYPTAQENEVVRPVDGYDWEGRTYANLPADEPPPEQVWDPEFGS